MMFWDDDTLYKDGLNDETSSPELSDSNEEVEDKSEILEEAIKSKDDLSDDLQNNLKDTDEPQVLENHEEEIDETEEDYQNEDLLSSQKDLAAQDDIDTLFGNHNLQHSRGIKNSEAESSELTLDQILMQESGDKLNFLNLDEDIPEHELSPDDLLALAWEKSILESSASSVNLDSFLSDSSSLGKNALKELDQSEIDSLLGFGSAPADIKNLTGIDAILNKSLIYYERLPMMEVVFDRLLRLLSTSLRNFTSDNVEISLESMKTMRFGDYLNSIPLPAMIGVFKAEEWDNGGILVVDSSLIYSIVDVLLGGKRSITASRVEGRPYTTIERNLIEKLMKVFLEELKSAFEPVSTVNFNFERLEINPHFAMISRSTNAGILVRLHVEIDDRGGRISLMLPYATIEPVRELLLQNFMGEKFGRDSIWEQHLASQLWETDVEFNVRLGTTTIPLGEVLNWKAGDYLGFPVTPASLVSAVSGDHELFKGNVGQKNGRVALQIEENILQKKMDSVAS